MIVLAVVAIAVVGGIVGFLLMQDGDGEQAATITSPGAEATPEVTEMPEATEPPLTPGPSGYNSRMDRIEVQGGSYAVHFEVAGFEPMLGGENKHVHFFFDTVPPSQAGAPGSGPWKLYPTQNGVVGESPFTGYGVGDVPQGASQICILVANSDHSVIQDTGNCLALP